MPIEALVGVERAADGLSEEEEEEDMSSAAVCECRRVTGARMWESPKRNAEQEFNYALFYICPLRYA